MTGFKIPRFSLPPGYRYCEPNFSGAEMKFHALYSKEFSMRDQNGDEAIVQVFNLYYQKERSRPTAIPFSSLINLKKHVAHVLMGTKNLEPRFKTVIELYLTQATTNAGAALDGIVETFRTAQRGNKEPLGFDMWWEDEPQVLL